MTDPLKEAKMLSSIWTQVSPRFVRPKWWQFRQKSRIRWMKRNKLPYTIVESKDQLWVL